MEVFTSIVPCKLNIAAPVAARLLVKLELVTLNIPTLYIAAPKLVPVLFINSEDVKKTLPLL